MSKEANVINYYVICNRLKNVLRTGWLYWNVKKERIESVAEHVYGVQMLAIAMKSEYQYDIDIMKVILMLAIHELSETIVGDLVQFDITPEDKAKKEHEAVHKILEPMIDGPKIEELIEEFDKRETKEALFAFQCDKFEADIQSKIYDQEGYVDINNHEINNATTNTVFNELLNKHSSWSKAWLEFSRNKYSYDSNFTAVSEYVENNDI